MFYGRFKMIFVYQIPIRMYACLKDITYLHEMSLHPYRPQDFITQINTADALSIPFPPSTGPGVQ